jgi:dipeptidyl aminopeptidase/acylaminoacyl peptidase
MAAAGRGFPVDPAQPNRELELMHFLPLRARVPLFLLLALSLLAGPAAAAGAPGALAASPDGRWFVVAVAEPSYDEEKRRSDLWIVPADGSAPPRRLTSGHGAQGDPAWEDLPLWRDRLVVFPDENHWILKGENSRYFYGEVHGWLAKYL